jgi:hypothetical protein
VILSSSSPKSSVGSGASVPLEQDEERVGRLAGVPNFDEELGVGVGSQRHRLVAVPLALSE